MPAVLSLSKLKMSQNIAETALGDDPFDSLWSVLDLATQDSPTLTKWRSFSVGKRVVPSFVFVGPQGGGSPIRVALIGCTNGDDLLSARAIAKLLLELILGPLFVEDLSLFVYPAANPPRNRSEMPDFESQFWKESEDPAIKFFEQELTGNEFDGVIVVKANEPISGLQILASSRVIATEVLWPAIESAQRFIPLASEPIELCPQLHKKENGLVSLDHIQPTPFTLILRTPKGIPSENQISAVGVGVKRILRDYRAFIGQADCL
jgi:hypothetical protein